MAERLQTQLQNQLRELVRPFKEEQCKREEAERRRDAEQRKREDEQHNRMAEQRRRELAEQAAASAPTSLSGPFSNAVMALHSNSNPSPSVQRRRRAARRSRNRPFPQRITPRSDLAARQRLVWTAIMGSHLFSIMPFISLRDGLRLPSENRGSHWFG